MKRSILIVDDDPEIRESLLDALAKPGTEIITAGSAEGALSELGSFSPDLVLADVRMPGMDGIELLRLLKERAAGISVILMTAFDDMPTVSTAMREGASDFLVKPLDLHHLRQVVERVFEDRTAGRLSEDADGTDLPPQQLIGHHPSMVEIFKMVGQVARTRTNVVIRGESGTGKELLARAIHAASAFAEEPFVPVNCTALPSTLLESELFGHVRGAFTGASADRKGRFALAGSGTIFLDEIGDTSPDFQSKLLRVLQEHEYFPVGGQNPERTEARVIAATHRNLEEMVDAGIFREDLYYRLRVVELQVPPLRDRLSDIPELARFLVRKASEASERRPPGLAPDTIEALLNHPWPGNVRELENCLTRAVVMATGDMIRPGHLSLGAPRRDSRHRLTTLEEVERDHIAFVLASVDGNRTRAAEILGISRPRIRRLIEKYALEAESDEDHPRLDVPSTAPGPS